MKLVDVHCHLESQCFKDNLSDVVKEAALCGVVKMLTASTVPSQWEGSLDIAKRFEEVECALGIHPWYISPSYRKDLPRLASFCEHGAVAVGEIGLDSKTAPAPLDEQKIFFEEQLSIAKELGLPAVIHCRGSLYDMVGSIKRLGGARGVIHSFNGSVEAAAEFIKLGLSFSMGGILTYRNSRKRAKLLKYIYPSHFLLETDSPDITPVEANKPNRPANIVYNLKAAAEILETAEEEIAAVTSANAANIFNLKI